MRITEKREERPENGNRRPVEDPPFGGRPATGEWLIDCQTLLFPIFSRRPNANSQWPTANSQEQLSTCRWQVEA